MIIDSEQMVTLTFNLIMFSSF